MTLRPATQSAYRACLGHLRKPENFGRARMTDITAIEVARFVTRQRAQGLKGWTIKGQLSVLSAVFAHATRHLGLVGANPVAALDRVERPSSDDQKAKRILTGDELARLLVAIGDEHRL